MQPAQQSTRYRIIEALPEELTGELVDGQVYAQSQPAARHMISESVLVAELLGPFQQGKGGPGGWWIINEPEIHFKRDIDVTVPDLAGWRRKRMPYPPEESHRFEVVPDWICEILSPSTRSRDREVKMPLYAHYDVQYIWLIDPIEHILEVYRLDAGTWLEIGRFSDSDHVSAPPFEAISIDLEDLWLPVKR